MHCWARCLLYLSVTLLGTMSLLSACGQKGPLYIPDEPPRHQRAEPGSS
jgi:predicted small lipoprotein YifL